MGQCVVSVHVTGGHHNGLASDIDQRAKQFVEQLKADGHNVTAAFVANGAEQNLLPPKSDV